MPEQDKITPIIEKRLDIITKAAQTVLSGRVNCEAFDVSYRQVSLYTGAQSDILSKRARELIRNMRAAHISEHIGEHTCIFRYHSPATPLT